MKKLIGARSIDILLQFLIEATFISITGRLISVVSGIAPTELVTQFLPWPTLVMQSFIMLSFLVWFFTGVFFDYYPAQNQTRILCYYNIMEGNGKEDLLWINLKHLNEQLNTLQDSGYHAILPDQLYQHLTSRKALPSKPAMLSFDDSHAGQLSIITPLMSNYGFKGVFPVVTVYIDKNNYLTSRQVKLLSDNRGIKAAFQLPDKASTTEPLFTLRRLMVSGSWTRDNFLHRITNAFKQ